MKIISKDMEEKLPCLFIVLVKEENFVVLEVLTS